VKVSYFYLYKDILFLDKNRFWQSMQYPENSKDLREIGMTLYYIVTKLLLTSRPPIRVTTRGVSSSTTAFAGST
jgi:hypothetical protein